MGLNNIELITDRSLDVNLQEIARVKKAHPGHALFVSLMVESKREAWHEIVKKVQDTGADGVELNFGCPHGMSERGMGSAVGQVPEYTSMITEWVKEVATAPVLVKLTPNVTDVTAIGRAAVEGGADGLSLINTINSVMGSGSAYSCAPGPPSAAWGATAATAGPAVQADRGSNMVAAVAADPKINVPIGGIGVIQAWQDAAEFFLLGARTVQVCTAVMHYGFRIVEHLADGLSSWMAGKKYAVSMTSLANRSLASRKWGDLDHQLQGHRPHRPGEMHSLRPLLRRLRGRLPPVDPPGEGADRRVHPVERARVVGPPLRRLRGPSRRRRGRGQPLLGEGRRLRRLQHVQPRLSGRGLHHDARGRHRQTADDLERRPGHQAVAAGAGEPIGPPEHA